MASYLAGCRNAVVGRINGGTYAKTLTARSVYTDTVESAINTTTVCDVMCRVVSTSEPDFQELPASRNKVRVLIPVEIVVAGAVAGKAATNLDGMLEVTEQIRARLWHREARELVSGGMSYKFVRAEINPITEPTTIQERHYAIFSLTAYYVHERTRGGL